MSKLIDLTRICLLVTSTIITSMQGKLEITSLDRGYRYQFSICPDLMVHYNTGGYLNSSFELILNPDYGDRTTDCHTNATQMKGMCYVQSSSVYEDNYYIQIVETSQNKKKMKSEWLNVSMTLENVYGPIVNLTTNLLKDSIVELSWIQNWKKSCNENVEMKARYQHCIRGNCIKSDLFGLYGNAGTKCSVLNKRADHCHRKVEIKDLLPYVEYTFHLQYETNYWSTWSKPAILVTPGNGKLEITSLDRGYRYQFSICPDLMVHYNTGGYLNSSFELILNPDYGDRTTDCHTNATQMKGMCYVQSSSVYEDNYYIQIVETLQNKKKMKSEWLNVSMTLENVYGPIVNLTTNLLKDSIVELSWIQNWKKSCNENVEMKARYQHCIRGNCMKSDWFGLYGNAGTKCSVLNKRADHCHRKVEIKDLLPYAEYTFHLQYEANYWSTWSKPAILVTPGNAPTRPPELICHLNEEEFAVLRWKVSRDDKFMGTIRNYEIYVRQKNILVDLLNEEGQNKDYHKYNKQLKSSTTFRIRSCTDRNCSRLSDPCVLDPKSLGGESPNDIIYVVCATVVVVILFLVALFLWKQKRKRNKKRSIGLDSGSEIDVRRFEDDDQPGIQPYASFNLVADRYHHN